jgi:phenylacetate-CoA ligase
MKHFTFVEYAKLTSKYFRDFRHISTFLQQPPDEIADIQFQKIQSLLRLAYDNTAFYRQLYSRNDIHPSDVTSWSEFRALPTVSKEDIIANHRDCIIDTHINSGRLRVTRSSGSSGQIVDIVTDSDFWIQTALMMLRMFQDSFHLPPFGRGALIYTSPYPFQSPRFFFRPHHLSTLMPSGRLIESLANLKPDYITAYPSVLSDLTSNFKEQCSRLQVKAISTNSEQSTQRQRDAISETFGCPVYDEYSTEEMSLGGFQCMHKNYHLQEDCAYFEILDPVANKLMQEAELGEIVGTCLINRVMPFIRYRQGDLGSMRTSNCACGNNGRILDDINGRKNSSFRLSDGRSIPSGRLLDWAYKLILDLDLPITDIQIIQTDFDVVRVVLAVRTPYQDAGLRSLLADSFKAVFNVSMSIELDQVTKIAKTPAGKHIPIRSLVK